MPVATTDAHATSPHSRVGYIAPRVLQRQVTGSMTQQAQEPPRPRRTCCVGAPDHRMPVTPLA
jgi:hypothetical protein